MQILKLLAPVVVIAHANAGVAQVVEGPQFGVFESQYVEAATARDALISGNVGEAIELGLPLAEAGNVVAQNVVGLALTQDDAAEYDPTAGMFWLIRAAAQDYPKAWHNLGEIWTDGETGIEPNAELALAAYLAGADLGYEVSFEEAVDLLGYGDDSVFDGEQAALLATRGLALFPENTYLRAVDIDAHYYGWGRPLDYAEALRLFEQMAEETGDSYAQFSAGYQYYYAEGAEYDPQKARDYFEQAAAQDHMAAMAHLAELYFRGYGIERSDELAHRFAEPAAEEGHPLAQTVMGMLHYYGDYVDQDFDLARSYLEQGRERGYLDAHNYLADMAYFGEGEPQDFEKAYQLYQTTLVDFPTDYYANQVVGYMRLYGEGVEADAADAARYLEVAHQSESSVAVNDLVVAYGHPDHEGPQSDPARALAFCLIANEREFLSGDDYPLTIFACDYLETTSTVEQAEAAIALYQTL